MKKVAMITLARDAGDAVARLRSLGVLHVEHINPPKGREVSELVDSISLVERAVSIVSYHSPEEKRCRGVQKRSIDWKESAHHIIDLYSRLTQLEEFASSLKQRISQWDGWGDFDPDTIKKLADKGVSVKLFRVPTRSLEAFPEGVIIKKISESGGMTNCAVIAKGVGELPLKELDLPKAGPASMRNRLLEDMKIIESIKLELEQCGCHYDTLIHAKEELKKELELQEAITGMGRDGKVSYITGFVPVDDVGKLTSAAKSFKWALAVRDPADDDNVPTFIRNPKIISIVEPVFKFLEIVPGYKELDISPLFLLFLSLFFGMIIGDAGYGLLYIAIIAFIQKKKSAKSGDKRVFFLLYLFSSSAVLWGLLTGTVFGQEWYLASGFKPITPALNDTKFLQAFCFFLGAFHLTIGHLWQAARKLPSITALADIGWVLVLWTAFLLAKVLILGYPMPFVTKWLAIAGILLVIFFTSPDRNILKTIGSGLGTVALSLMNNFTDIVSYIRLFAVGLAGVAISDTVNALAGAFGENSIATKVIILFIGHAINIVLGPISVLVHGVRLNVLEFSGHAGLSWSGTRYNPLKK